MSTYPGPRYRRAGTATREGPAVLAQPGPFDLELYQGDTYALSITLTDKDSGVPVDLTGSTAAAQIRATAAAPEVLADFVATVDGPSGTIHLDLPAADSAAVPPGPHVWDVETTDTTGRVRTWLAGAAVVTAEVTRP
jgi:hypothetical protein